MERAGAVYAPARTGNADIPDCLYHYRDANGAEAAVIQKETDSLYGMCSLCSPIMVKT